MNPVVVDPATSFSEFTLFDVPDVEAGRRIDALRRDSVAAHDLEPPVDIARQLAQRIQIVYPGLGGTVAEFPCLEKFFDTDSLSKL